MTPFQRVAAEVQANLLKRIATDRDSEWHRVNSSVADILKDSSMLFSKLARLQSDFVGSELEQLEGMSDKILTLGQEMAQFARSFYEGDFAMNPSETQFGNPNPNAPVEPGQQPAPAPQTPAQPTQVFQPPADAAAPPVIPEFEVPPEEEETEEEETEETEEKTKKK